LLTIVLTSIAVNFSLTSNEKARYDTIALNIIRPHYSLLLLLKDLYSGEYVLDRIQTKPIQSYRSYHHSEDKYDNSGERLQQKSMVSINIEKRGFNAKSVLFV
jgi:hypothetical protein